MRYERFSLHTRYTLCILGVLLLFPFGTASAQVVINEIAWMGTLVSSDDEWMELHNRGSAMVDVTNWTITDGQSLAITLTGTIDGNSYALLERTDDTSVPGVTMFQSYVGALPNAGRTLTLKSADGLVVDSVVGGDVWGAIGGDNETKHTPQRTSADAWITAAPTPGANNATVTTVVPVVSSTTNMSTTVSSSRTTSRSGGSRVVRGTPPAPRVVEALSLSITAPTIAYVNQPVTFTALPHGPGKTILDSLSYTWNFGDTYTATTKTPTHAFQYPGEYVVVAEATYAKQHAQVRHDIIILPASFTLARGSSGEIIMTNQSSHEVDIGGYTLVGARSFEFPKHTILKAGKTMAVPVLRIGVDSGSITMLDRGGVAIATLAQKTTASSILRSATLAPTPPTPTAVVATTTTASAVVPTTTQIIRIGEQSASLASDPFASRLFKQLARFFGF